MRPTLKWLSAATSSGMFLVLIAGALVTKTESGRGCGDDWPLCNGRFIPAYTLESMIEYSHRAVSGIVGILVLITAIAVYRAYGRKSESFYYAFGALFFTILQAILGAMAVLWEQSPVVMALHFGFSLLAFSFTLLLVLVVWRVYKHEKDKAASQGEKETRLAGQRITIIQPSFQKLVWYTTIYSYIVVYIGAFVRHTESSAGCTGWPLCNGQVIPELTGTTAIAFGHRIAALILLVLVVWIAVIGRSIYGQWPEIRKMSAAILLLILMQIASGAWVTLIMGSVNVYVFASLIHTMIIAALFAVLCYLSIRVWQLSKHNHMN